MTTKDVEQRWVKYGEEQLLGRKIVKVRYMSQKEVDALGWNERAIVLELDNGTLIYPAQDDEGNGAGTLFGNTKKNDELTFPVL